MLRITGTWCFALYVHKLLTFCHSGGIDYFRLHSYLIAFFIGVLSPRSRIYQPCMFKVSSTTINRDCVLNLYYL